MFEQKYVTSIVTTGISHSIFIDLPQFFPIDIKTDSTLTMLIYIVKKYQSLVWLFSQTSHQIDTGNRFIHSNIKISFIMYNGPFAHVKYDYALTFTMITQ